MRGESKLLVICKTMAPIVTGSTVILKNLFDSYKGEVEGIAGWEYGAKVDVNYKLSFKTHYLKFPPLIQRLFERRFVSIYHRLVVWFIKKKLKEIRPSAVFIGVTPDGIFCSAAVKACVSLDIPFFGQMHDLWEENTSIPFLKGLARQWEPVLFEKSNKIFSMTKTQQEFYVNKYGIKPDVFPHTVPDVLLNNRNSTSLQETEKPYIKRIVYSGNISLAMNLDAMKSFVKTVDLLPDNYEIIILINSNKEQLERNNIYHSRIKYDWVSVEEARIIQNKADVLFLPLSHKNGSMLEVKTVFSTKTLDYFISGTPILVYSPEFSFHSISAKEEGWGYVINKDSPQAIVDGIINLCEDQDLAISIVNNAIKEAKRRSSDKYATILYEKVLKL